MDKMYLARNIADCERRIEGLEPRLKNAKDSGEDAKWLKSEIDGYKETLKKLSNAEPD